MEKLKMFCEVGSTLQLLARVAGVRYSWTLRLAHFLLRPNQEYRQAASPCLYSSRLLPTYKNLWLDNMSETQGSLEAAGPPVTKCHHDLHLVLDCP